MNPLFFLVSRTTINGIKRSFSSPSRAMGTLFFIFSQLYWIGSSLFRAVSSPAVTKLPMTLPNGVPMLVTGVVFAFFAVSSWFWGLGLFTAPFGFQRADSDCLFPTPVDNRAILNLHLIRNTLFKLLMPVVGTAVLWRPVKALSDQIASGEVSTDTVAGVFRTAVLVYLLLMTFWTLARYASVLMTAGTEKARVKTRNRMVLAVNLVTLASVAAYAWLFSFYFRDQGFRWETLPVALNDRRLWWFQPVGALGAVIALGPVNGSFGTAAVALLALVGGAFVCAQLCYRYAGRLSELGLQSIDVYEKFKRSRTQNPQDVVAERARRGGFKSRAPRFLENWSQSGEGAFVWREMVLVARVGKFSWILTLLTSAVVCGVFGRLDMSTLNFVPAPFFLTLLCAMTASNMAQTGMREFLKRNDLIRPLPLSTGKLLRTEALARSAVGVVSMLPGLVTWGVVAPWSILISPLVLFFGAGVNSALVGVTTWAVILLPDIEDPTQRSFRQLVTGLGVLFCLAVVSGSFIGLAFLTHGLALPCVVSGILGIGMGFGASLGAERAYANYVPNE